MWDLFPVLDRRNQSAGALSGGGGSHWRWRGR